MSISTRKKKKNKLPKLSRQAKPEGMSLEDWQLELRRQFGREQRYLLVNRGDHPVFSEFEVTNPESRSTYRVVIRGVQTGQNHCSCPDFATNLLGTCKHIEFTLRRLTKRPRTRALLREGYQPNESEIYLEYGTRREVHFRSGAECPRELARLASQLFDAEGTLLPEGFARLDEFVSESQRLGHEILVRQDVAAFVAEVRDAELRAQRLAEAFPKGVHSAAFKDLLRVNLYEYQREGALFAARAGRCLIGDEMGLGKTIQAIAAAEIMARIHGVERVLVITPTSLKYQWQREIEKFSERSAVVVGGLRSSREELFRQESFFKVMNYDTVHHDLDLIREWSPDLVILDEAQRIKNWATRVARSVKKIQTSYAIVLTGTPLENRLEELVSIVQFVDRYRLGPTYRLLHDHQKVDKDGKVIGYRDLDRIGKTLEPVLIRRQKRLVLDQLPGRLDKHFFVPMTELQRKIHQEAAEIVVRIVAKWKRYKFLSEADKQRLMTALQIMRMSCDSAYLVDQQNDVGPKADEFITLTKEILEEPGAKIVVFSQWLRMHELLTRRLEQAGFGYVLFHGGVPSKKRGELTDRFRDDSNCRLFLSTDSGGVGLNLQHASVVINMDLPWNPAVLEQRIGRVHRLGQKNPVRVVNFVSTGTIEEGMIEVLRFKKSLFAGVLDGGEKEISLNGTRLTKFMETVERATTSIPTAPIEDQTEPFGEPTEARGAAAPEAQEATPAPSNPLAGLMEVGVKLLESLRSASQPSKAGGSKSSLVERDERTGETYLRLPMPKPEAIEQAAQALRVLLDSFAR